jgi:hypothetical protein
MAEVVLRVGPLNGSVVAVAADWENQHVDGEVQFNESSRQELAALLDGWMERDQFTKSHLRDLGRALGMMLAPVAAVLADARQQRAVIGVEVVGDDALLVQAPWELDE